MRQTLPPGALGVAAGGPLARGARAREGPQLPSRQLQPWRLASTSPVPLKLHLLFIVFPASSDGLTTRNE